MNKNGFTLAEVMLALFVLAGSVYILSGLNFRAARKVMVSTEEIDRVFFVKKELYNLYFSYFSPIDKEKKELTKPIKVTLDEPDVEITTYKQDIDAKKSDLKKLAKDIEIIWSEGEWKRGVRTHKLKMISFAEKTKKKINSD
jgi:prepilin-type N-terminal cleavage/methylation domain-containing protein